MPRATIRSSLNKQKDEARLILSIEKYEPLIHLFPIKIRSFLEKRKYINEDSDIYFGRPSFLGSKLTKAKYCPTTHRSKCVEGTFCTLSFTTAAEVHTYLAISLFSFLHLQLLSGKKWLLLWCSLFEKCTCVQFFLALT